MLNRKMKCLSILLSFISLSCEALRIPYEIERSDPDKESSFVQGATTDPCGESFDYKFREGTPSDIESQIRNMNLQGDYTQLANVMKRAANGQETNILVYGGSATAGADCLEEEKEWRPRETRLSKVKTISGDKARYMECAWPRRMELQLQKIYKNKKIKMHNMGIGGTDTSGWLPTIGPSIRAMHEQVGKIDAVILDLLTNDAYDEGHNISSTFEQFVRTLHHLTPDSAIYVLVAGCARCHAVKNTEIEIAEHYKLPLLDFAAITVNRQGEGQLMGEEGTVHGVHPAPDTHQLIADTMSEAWTRAHVSRCKEASFWSEVFPQKSLWWPEASFCSEKDLKEVATCESPLSWYSAISKPDGVIINSGDWQRYEDRPGKFGWIAKEKGSTITFPLKFGSEPRLLFTYLRGYEGLGDASITMNGKTYKIEGVGKSDGQDHGLPKATQTFTRVFQVSVEGESHFDHPTRDGFNLPPNSTDNLVVESLGNKFKIISVASC